MENSFFRSTWRGGVTAAALATVLCTGVVAGPLPEPVHLGGHEQALPLAPHVQVLEDPTHALELAHVQAAVSGWNPGPARALALGFSKSAWWVRMSLSNRTSQPHEFIVDLGTARQDHVHWFVTAPNGELLKERRSGSRTPFATRPVDFRGLALPLTLGPAEQVDVYMRLSTHDGLFESMPLSISGGEEFISVVRLDTMMLGLYFGAMLALGLYNLLLFISTREIGFGLYVAFLFSFLAWNFTYTGFSFEYFWPDSPQLNYVGLLTSAALTYASLGLFAMRYMRMAQTVKQRPLLKVYQVTIGLNLLALVPAWLDYYAFGVAVSLALGMPLVAMTLVSGGWLAWRGSREARFLTVAFLMPSLGLIVFALQLAGTLPVPLVGAWSLQIGSMFEMLLLAFGLADSMNALKAQKLLAEQRALEAKSALAADLEVQVHERTRDLEKVNLRLVELSITDELTNAYNRRHFNDYCRNALSNQSRGEPLALCMFDLDYFKSYNDHYGHQAGDSALRDIAKAVSAKLKRSGDYLFRLGGEEFGVLFTAASAVKAEGFVEALRLTVRRLERTHVGNPVGVMTASFGVSWWPPSAMVHLTPDAMYVAVDQLLYRAKRGGRDRVVMDTGSALPESGDKEAGVLQH